MKKQFLSFIFITSLCGSSAHSMGTEIPQAEISPWISKFITPVFNSVQQLASEIGRTNFSDIASSFGRINWFSSKNLPNFGAPKFVGDMYNSVKNVNMESVKTAGLEFARHTIKLAEENPFTAMVLGAGALLATYKIINKPAEVSTIPQDVLESTVAVDLSIVQKEIAEKGVLATRQLMVPAVATALNVSKISPELREWIKAAILWEGVRMGDKRQLYALRKNGSPRDLHEIDEAIIKREFYIKDLKATKDGLPVSKENMRFLNDLKAVSFDIYLKALRVMIAHDIPFRATDTLLLRKVEKDLRDALGKAN